MSDKSDVIRWSRSAVYIIIALICMIVSTGCSQNAAQPETSATEAITEATPSEAMVIESETTEPETMEVPDERVEIDGMIQSYLTGEMKPVEIANRRPIAIMMSNDKQALPQYGINRADVVYEAPVEGVMNRYMAVIEDYDDLERIGSVRSCRTYYTYFAREWDAIYAHYGQSTFAKPYLKNVDNINGLDAIGGTAYYRSKDRKAPHNAYSSGERLNKSIEILGYSQEYSDDYEGHFKFRKPDDDEAYEDGIGAAKVVPGYTYNEPWFEYNEEDGLYYRYQYGDKHMGDEGQIAVKNIFFEYSPTGHYATTDYLNINVHEDTYGFYFSDGVGIPVSVKKDGEFGVTHFYDASGEEVKVNTGKTWICIIDSSKYNDTEIYDKDGSSTKPQR